MKTLAIETSGVIGGVALWDGALVGERLFAERMNHAEELFPAIEALSQDAGWAPDAPDLIAVSIGPGSYTGLRVGIAAAKMLSYTIDAALIGVPSLDALVQNVPGEAGMAAPIIDAKRKQVYSRLYEWQATTWAPASDLSIDPPAELAARLRKGTTVFGNGAEQYADVFASAGLVVAEAATYTQARPRVVAELGARLYEAGERTDREALIPIYLRRPEAEEKKGAEQTA